MISLRHKEAPTHLTFKNLTEMSTKDELKKALSFYGYSIPSKSKKEGYIKAVCKVAETDPKALLQSLTWDSLMIVKEIIDGGKGTFVKRPKAYFSRDIEDCLAGLAYHDEKNYTSYFTLLDELYDAFAPIIDCHLESPTAQMHKLIDPWVSGLCNLYGLCPEPLILDTLRKNNVLPKGEKLYEDKYIRGVLQTTSFFPDKFRLEAGSAPRPFDTSKNDILFYPSPNIHTDKDSIWHLLDCLKADGLFHYEYRPFTKEEILGASGYNPDFNFPEAIKLKDYLKGEGNTSEEISYLLTKFWLTRQGDDEQNEQEHLEFKSHTLQALYDDFIKHVSKWVCRGYKETETEGEFEGSIKDFQNYLTKEMESYKAIKDEADYPWIPSLSKHPAIKPAKGTDFIARFAQKLMIEVVIDAEQNEFFTCYLINQQFDGFMYLVTNFGHLFDFIDERYKEFDEYYFTKHFMKKYPVITRLLSSAELRDTGCTYMTTIGFNKRPKQWYVVRRIKPLDWASLVMTGATNLKLIPEIMDSINALYDDVLDLCDEIEASDSVSLKEEFKKLKEK